MTTAEVFYRLLMASACGAVIGINRDLHHKSAGFRTISMVSVGSAIVAMIAVESGSDPNAVSRIMQGVLTGIGFLGAGVILHPATSMRVAGLTTAASIWLTAGLGIASGLGLYRLVGCGLLVAFVILVAGGPIERRLERFAKRRHTENAVQTTKLD
ncbi:MAG: MgtC/SapB family protein [Pseudomonadota bacterium]|nr:MgtC/SapB family protein [Pseudomonadota bacterium]